MVQTDEKSERRPARKLACAHASEANLPTQPSSLRLSAPKSTQWGVLVGSHLKRGVLLAWGLGQGGGRERALQTPMHTDSPRHADRFANTRLQSKGGESQAYGELGALASTTPVPSQLSHDGLLPPLLPPDFRVRWVRGRRRRWRGRNQCSPGTWVRRTLEAREHV